MSRNRATEEALAGLHATLARKLQERIESGECTASDLNVARQFLKDNGIEAVPGDGPLDPLEEALKQAGMEPYEGERGVSH